MSNPLAAGGPGIPQTPLASVGNRRHYDGRMMTLAQYHAARLADLRKMPFAKLSALVASGKAGPLAKQVYYESHQVKQGGTVVEKTAKNPHYRVAGEVVQTPHGPGVVQHDGSTKSLNGDPKNVSGTKRLPTHGMPPNSPKGHPHGGNGGGGPADFTAMLTKLLGQSDTAYSLPKSLADKIAGVDTAAASGFQDQLDHLPAAKKAALKDIANWYGQVSKSEGTAATRDKAMADAGSSAMQDAAKGIMSSLGGSAMAGSGEIGAVGANDANTLSAMGANDKMLAADLGPIFKLAQANASNSRAQQYDQAKSGLQDSLAAAQGKAETDRANALMAILQANNQARQTNFGNQSGLLNTLASLQISGANAQSQAQSRAIENALRVSEINKNSSKNAGGLAAMTPQERADFVDKIVQGISTGKLSWPAALRAARNSVRSAGMNPMNKQVINTIIGPALSNAGITGQGGGFWPAIYQP